MGPNDSILLLQGGMQMASCGLWLKVYSTLLDHRKTLQLAESLDIDVPKAIGHLICFWMWAMVNADADGFLEGATPLMVARASQWDLDSQEFVSALLKSRFLERDADGYKVRNWAEYGGKLAKRRERDKLRKKSKPDSDGIPTDVRRNSDGIPMDVQRISEEFPPLEVEVEVEVEKEVDIKPKPESKSKSKTKPTSFRQLQVENATSDEVVRTRPKENVPYKDIMELWNSIIGSKGIPSIRGLTDQRKVKLRRLWRNQSESGDFSQVETWREFFTYIAEKCSFLMSGTWNFGFDWILSPSNFQKIIEGNYEDRQKGAVMAPWNRRA
jgi:hypothetical protein